MAFSEKIRLIFDIDSAGASSGIGKIKTSIRDADGAFGKMKAGAKSTFDGLKQYSAEAALAAGTALVAFAVQAVKAFQDTALEAGRFGEATGLAVDDASRWIEVAGDMGIEAGSVEGAIRRFNLALADGKPSIQEYGIEVIKTKDGVIDANATFQDAVTKIGAIEDPTKRAQAAQELFGKSYGSIAEIMAMDAGQLQTALQNVSDEKVINQEELDKARKFRESMDTLKDSLEDVQLAVGGMVAELAPAISNMAEMVGLVTDLAAAVPEIDLLGSAFVGFTNPVLGAKMAMDSVGESTAFADMTLAEMNATLIEVGASEDEIIRAHKEWDEKNKSTEASTGDLTDAVNNQKGPLAAVRDLMEQYGRKADEASESTRTLDEDYSKLTGKLTDREAWLNLQTSIEDWYTGLGDATLGARDQELALIDLKKKLADYGVELDGIDPEKKTEILALIDQGKIGEVYAILEELTKPRTVSIRAVNGGLGGIRSYASGTSNHPGGLAIVGEQGPELVDLPRGSAVTPAGPTAAMLNGAGGVVNNYINITTGADPRQVISEIKRYQQRGGIV